MAWEDRLDEELYWHDWTNSKHTQDMLDEQDEKRAAEARRHAEDIATLQGTVDELKQQLAAERKARTQAEKERADAEARYRFNMWKQTPDGEKYLKAKFRFEKKALIVDGFLKAIEEDLPEATERWVVNHGLLPDLADFGLTSDGMSLIKKPLFGEKAKYAKAVNAYNAAVEKVLANHRAEARADLTKGFEPAWSQNFWKKEVEEGRRIIKLVEEHSRFDLADSLPHKYFGTLERITSPNLATHINKEFAELQPKIDAIGGQTLND